MKDKVSLTTLTLAKAYTDEQGGGGGGTSNYNDLTHKPTVNGVEFKGTMTGETLGLVDAEDGKGLSTNDYTDADKSIVGGVTSALAGKVDKVSGKGLSTNDYDDSAKAIVDGVTTALNGKVDKVSGKGLSTNDYSNADKTIVDGVTSALNEKTDKTETYLTTDSAETSLTDNDKFPFYDISVTDTKHSTWSNIKSKLKTYFDTLYATPSSLNSKMSYEDNGIVGAQNLLGANMGMAWNTNGNLQESTHAISSDKIKVVAGQKFSFSKSSDSVQNVFTNTNDNLMIRKYDSTGAYVSSSTGLSYNATSSTFTVPSGTGYIALTQYCAGQDMTKALQDSCEVIACLGNSTTYREYAMTNRELTGELDGKLDKINGVFDDPAEPIVGDIYNSEEQVVGTWGKQGHEKTLYMSALMSEGNIPFNTENSEILEVESHNIANIDEIVFAQFTCKPSSANVWSPLPHKKKYITIDRTDIIGYTSNSSNEQAAIKGLVYYTKTS